MAKLDTVLSSISSEFQRANQASWLGTAYVHPYIHPFVNLTFWQKLLASNMHFQLVSTFPITILAYTWLETAPLYGRLCNVLGRRGANQVAVLSAGIGTLCCGLSQNMEMLIVSRFVSSYLLASFWNRTHGLQLSGLGGGGIFTTSQWVQMNIVWNVSC